jgi:hypothetical protein
MVTGLAGWLRVYARLSREEEPERRLPLADRSEAELTLKHDLFEREA